MDPAIRSLIEALHRVPCKYVLAVTGGGSGAVAALLNVPGGSRTILEVSVPYDGQALAEFLGHPPVSACSAATARDMARRAQERARWLAPGEAVAGIGCTASLATDRPKRGDHRFHLAVQSAERVASYSLTLQKGTRDRPGEEAVLDAVLLNALAEAFAVPQRLPVPLLPVETVQVETTSPADPLAGFLRGDVPCLCSTIDGCWRAEEPKPAVVLPGSFNPVHAGHWRLAATAVRLVGSPAAFELSVLNVDKPPLSAEEVRQRRAPFLWRAPLWLTRAPTFAEKALLFPNAVFVVGVDTAARIVAPRYYGGSEERMQEALDGIRAQGCRFLVAGRAVGADRFLQLGDLPMPDAWRDLFTAIPESEFHVDLSSTQLRESARH